MSPKMMRDGLESIVNDYYDDRVVLYEFFFYFCKKYNDKFDEDKFIEYYNDLVYEYNRPDKDNEMGIWNENQLNNQYI